LTGRLEQGRPGRDAELGDGDGGGEDAPGAAKQASHPQLLVFVNRDVVVVVVEEE
jgi:hypothetical protein